MTVENISAFPTHDEEFYYHGMSLRDYFAAKAMAAYLTSPITAKDATDKARVCAEWAYIQADAMLAERDK